nr:transglycosylase [Mesotoga sp.]
MDKGKRLDLIVLLMLLTSIVVISGLLVGFGNRLSPKKVASLAILYNAGLGANREDFLNNS